MPRTQVQIDAYYSDCSSGHGVPEREASSVQGQKCRPVFLSCNEQFLESTATFQITLGKVLKPFKV